MIGLCGETLISNEGDTWVTMMQVYEYFISHHMAKAFESLFGTVTCLPGCFCMYRLRAPASDGRDIPILMSNEIIREYSDNEVDTLHKKVDKKNVFIIILCFCISFLIHLLL